MRVATLICLLAVAGLVPAHAQVPAPVDASANLPISDMDAVVVTGVQPGPGMWKVSKGDHVLWVLGVQSPLPKHMQWHSPDVEAAIAQAQEVIDPPGLGLMMGFGGMFKAMFALPTLLKVRKNPEGRTLQEVLPPDLYARWSQLKVRYPGSDRDIEQWRPIFAAQSLYDAALRQAGLEGSGAITRQVEQIAKREKISQTSSSVAVAVTDPKGLAKSFARAPVDDIACFRATLDRLDVDVATAVARANAWAVGDLEALRQLSRPGQGSCLKAISDTDVARSLGLSDADSKLRTKWLVVAEAALAKNQSSFAVLSVDQLLSADSYLASLQAKGYVVEAPE